MIKIVKSTIGTKFSAKWGDLLVNLAVKAVRTVYQKDAQGNVEIDVKRYAKVEKIPGGVLEDCRVLDGVMYNKDVTHPNMRREIRNPRVVLLDCPLEYKKGESMTNIEFTKEEDFKKALNMEETEVMRMCEHILAVKPDIVITEKGVSDIAQHYLLKKGNVSCIRRLRKTDNNRVARVTGATIVNRPEELQEKDVGKDCGLFEVKKIGDDYFSFMTECKNPSACSIVLRGSGQHILDEAERSLHDAICVLISCVKNHKVIYGGGNMEVRMSLAVQELANSVEGKQALAIEAFAHALR